MRTYHGKDPSRAPSLERTRIPFNLVQGLSLHAGSQPGLECLWEHMGQDLGGILGGSWGEEGSWGILGGSSGDLGMALAQRNLQLLQSVSDTKVGSPGGRSRRNRNKHGVIPVAHVFGQLADAQNLFGFPWGSKHLSRWHSPKKLAAAGSSRSVYKPHGNLENHAGTPKTLARDPRKRP